MKNMQKMAAFAKRTTLEIARDPLTLFFGAAFPVILLLLMSLIQANIPVDLFRMERLAPGVMVFGHAFITLFAALLIARDRSTSFLLRLFATPMRASDYLGGYLLPLLPLALLQGVLLYAVALLLGLPFSVHLLFALGVGLLCSLIFAAMGLLFGSILSDKQVGGICGALLTNLTAWLSGVWFDIKLLGGAFGAVARALPFYHAVEACREATAGQYAALPGHLAVVLAYAAVLMALAVWCFGRQMQEK